VERVALPEVVVGLDGVVVRGAVVAGGESVVVTRVDDVDEVGPSSSTLNAA